MSSKKVIALTISLLLLLPVCKNWISYLISTYEDYKANEIQEEKTILIDDEVETIDAKEEEDDSPEITDKETDEHVSQKDQNKLASQNNVETQDPASKKEKKQLKAQKAKKKKVLNLVEIIVGIVFVLCFIGCILLQAIPSLAENPFVLWIKTNVWL